MSRKPDSVPHFSAEAEERTYWEHHDSADHVDWSKAAKGSIAEPETIVHLDLVAPAQFSSGTN